MSHVYFIQCGATQAIKIGISGNPWARMSKMQSDSPGELKLLALMCGGRDEEAALHGRFAAYRVRGEWFRPSAALTALTDSLGRPARPRKVRTAQTSPTLLAAATGIAVNYASQFIAGKRKPTVPMALRIYDASGLVLGGLANLTQDEIEVVRGIYARTAAA